MYILWKNHPYKPELNGTKEHVARSLAEVAIGYGQAELAKRPNYGTPEWAAERKALSAKVTHPDPHDVVPATSDGVSWSVKVQAKGKVVVLRNANGQLDYLDSPPSGCPLTIVQQYKDAVAQNPEANALALEQAKQKQYAQDAADKTKSRIQIMVAQVLGKSA